MTENQFLLEDRIQKIKSINDDYDLINNSYIAYSGGKDSNVLSKLIDITLPDNNIPRVYIDTGIELNSVRNFVTEKQKIDKRIIIIKPAQNIKAVLLQHGFPFKSKEHSCKYHLFHSGSRCKSVKKYFMIDEYQNTRTNYTCPKALLYQKDSPLNFPISDKCCYKLKKEPAKIFEKQTGRNIKILGIRKSERGQRTTAGCVSFSRKSLKSFQPLIPLENNFMDWFISEYNIELPSVYYPPYNFTRTGCKGCPFNKDLERDLEVLKEYFPNEEKQCELIWGPVYTEYRRIGYRLKS